MLEEDTISILETTLIIKSECMPCCVFMESSRWPQSPAQSGLFAILQTHQVHSFLRAFALTVLPPGMLSSWIVTWFALDSSRSVLKCHLLREAFPIPLPTWQYPPHTIIIHFPLRFGFIFLKHIPLSDMNLYIDSLFHENLSSSS